MEESRGATTTAPPAEPGPRTDRLELLQQLGGSVGTVHKARNPKLNRTVALRQIQVPEWLDDVDDLIKRILAEARAASGFDHPNIARLYTGGYKGFTVFLTSEFVEGTAIREYVSSRNLGVIEILALGKQLCSALDFAHKKNVFHNALTPANLKVSADGHLKLLDFGLLRDKHLYSPSPAKRLENEHYLSPEQVKNKPVTQAANVFTAATILYELLTTRNPFAGKHLGEVDRNIAEIDPPPASQAHSRVSEALSRVLMKAFAKHPLGRYQSCADFAVALEGALKETPAKAGLSVVASALSPATPSIKPASPSMPSKPAVAVADNHVSPDASGTSGNGWPRPPLVVQRPTPTKPVGPAVGNDNLAAPAPGKMPVRMLTQWKLVGGITAAVFVITAVAISLTHRSKVTNVIREAVVQALEKKPVQGPVAVPERADLGAPVVTNELPSRTAKQRMTRAASISAPPGAANGVLAISSEPEGASFTIEGRTTEEWKTPQVVGSLAPAVYKVTVTKTGYSTETGYVQVVSGNRATINLRLKALKATLSIGGTPVGARIVIDGKDTGRFSPAEFTLDPSVHTITLHREGFFDNSGQVNLAAGETINYAPSMTPEGRTDNIKVVGGIKKLFGGGSAEGMARLTIKTDPKGAQVLVNGAALSKPTPVEIQLEPGNYEIILQKDGYQPMHKILAVQASDKLRIDEQLFK